MSHVFQWVAGKNGKVERVPGVPGLDVETSSKSDHWLYQKRPIGTLRRRKDEIMKSTSALVTGSGEDVVLLILSSDSSMLSTWISTWKNLPLCDGRSRDVRVHISIHSFILFIFIYLFLFKAIFWTQI